MSRNFIKSWAALLLAVPGCAWAQPSPVIKAETRVVLVDAVVTGKKDEFVQGLTAKDFHVYEDKKEQKVESFSVESASRANTAEPRTGYLVLLFDYDHMSAAGQIRARQAAAGFIDANTGPEHLIAVANFDGAFRIAQGFTANPGRLKEVVNGSRSQAASVTDSSTTTSAQTDLGARSLFRALRSLAQDLASVPGRKTIVLFTGGLPASNEQKPLLNDAIKACQDSDVAVYPIDVRDVALANTLSADSSSTDNPSTAGTPMGRRGGGFPVIRSNQARGDADPSAALDPGGLTQQVVFALANGTGGFVIQNAGELPAGLQKIGEEQTEYYVLGYTPPESKEGTCHALRVKVDRSGIKVRARASYCTGKAAELLTGTAAERNLESQAAAGKAGNIAATMQLPFFYIGPNTARVHVAMDIPRDAVKFERKNGEDRAAVEILGIASTAHGPDEGSVAARFSDTLSLDPDEASAEKDKPLHFEKEFKIASGQYNLTVAFSSGGQSFGKIEQPLTVEPYQPGQIAISGVAFGTEIRKAGADAAASLFDDRTPLRTGDVDLVPAGSNVFTKGGKGYCYFEVYVPEGSMPGAVSMRVYDAKTGDLELDGGAMKLDSAGGGKPMVALGLNVPIQSLVPGAHRLEISATEGEQTVKRDADFELK